MARGKGKYGPKSKTLVVLKSANHKFLENALSKLIFSKVENGTPYGIFFNTKGIKPILTICYKIA